MLLTSEQYESCNNQTSDALDAYTRAADLDPSNVHIKARLALLKGQPTNGQPAGAPLPQDVHPQAYQPNALGGPPGPQWGAHAQNPPPGPAPPPLAAGNNWNGGRPAELQNPQMQPQPANPFDQRDRASQQQAPPRQPSPPRQDPMRQYQEQPQRPPPPAHRGLSPSPKGQHSNLAPFQPGSQHGAQSLPAHQGAPPMQPPQEQQQRTPYGPPPPTGGPAPNGMPGQSMGMPPYGRPEQPQPEIRPLVGQSAPSPSNHYSRPPYEHHPNSAPSIADGAPPPNAALMAADAAAREREQRPSSTVPAKRGREWEDDMSASKKPSTEEGRSRLDEIKLQRPSPPDKVATPPARSPQDQQRRMDEQRPPSAYRPSDAAHHPPALPPMQSLTQPSPRGSAAPQEEHRAPPPPPQQQAPPPVYEPAARKMEVDENYDDSGDDKSATKQESRLNSPRPAGAAGGAAPMQGVEQQA